MYFGNLGMRMLMTSQMPMGFWGNFSMMNYVNPMFSPGASIFNVYQYPMMNFNFNPTLFSPTPFNFGLTTGFGAQQTVTGQTQEQKNKTIDEIRKLNYNSSELKAKIAQNDNISDYANYFTSNSSFKLSKTIDAEDGGKIYLYEDKDGNNIGSVNKDPNGKIRNVSLTLADEGYVSLNDNNNFDGKIDYKVAASKNETQTDKNGQKFEDILKNILAKYPNATSTSKQHSNGDVLQTYTSNGKNIILVLKDSKGKIKDIIDETSKSVTIQYTDTNSNGKIDADEHIKRQNIDL